MSVSPTPPGSEGIYVAIDDNQQGPFNDEEIQQMLYVGRVRPSSLGWREGMSDWAPLKNWYAPAQPVSASSSEMAVEPPPIDPAVPERKEDVAFYLGIGGIGAWFVVLVVIGVLTSTGHDSEGMKIFFGLLVFALLGLNLVGAILGLMDLIGAPPRSTRAAIGFTLSVLQILAIVALIAFGNAHPPHG